MNRRQFLKLSGLAAIFSFSARELFARPQKIYLAGDGITDDTIALQTWGRGETVYDRRSGEEIGNVLEHKKFLLSDRISVRREYFLFFSCIFVWEGSVGFDFAQSVTGKCAMIGCESIAKCGDYDLRFPSPPYRHSDLRLVA